MSIRQLPELQAFTGLGQAGRELHMRAAEMWNAEVRAAQSSDNNVISILEPIGADFFGNGFTDKRMSAALRAIGNQDVIVQINSPGGVYLQGVSMYNMLRAHPKKVTVQILGMAASAASLIAMAGDRIEMAKSGFVFVHNTQGVTVGDRHAHGDTIEVLATFDEAARAIYAARTGLSDAEAANLMDKETLMGSKSAIDKGFADGLLAPDKITNFRDPEAAMMSAYAKLDAALSSMGMSRGTRRKLLKDVTGMPGAAEDAKPCAGVSPGLAKTLAKIDIPLST